MSGGYGRSVVASRRAGVLSLYAAEPLATRAHVRVRWATCPFRAVAAEVPPAGRVLDVGCGHGLLALHLALDSPGRQVLGIDVDAGKLAVAEAAAARAGVTASFREVSGPELADGPFDAVTIVDVLYLLAPADQHGLLRAAAARLAPGGVVVVKEMAPAPRWKAAWNLAQETLAVRLLGITEGEELAFVPPADLAATLEAEGLAVRHRPVHRGYPHPHHLVVGRRPAP